MMKYKNDMGNLSSCDLYDHDVLTLKIRLTGRVDKYNICFTSPSNKVPKLTFNSFIFKNVITYKFILHILLGGLGERKGEKL